MFVPLFPIYVKGFGISVTELGIILASFAIARIIFQVPFGAISDRIGRKFLIVSALFAYSGIIVLYALSSNTYEFLVFRFRASYEANWWCNSATGSLSPHISTNFGTLNSARLAH